MNGQENQNIIDSDRSSYDINSNHKKITTNFNLNTFQKNELRKFFYKIENIVPSQSSFQICILKDDLGYIADIVIDSLYTSFNIYLIENDFEILICKAKQEIASQVKTWKGMRFLGRSA